MEQFEIVYGSILKTESAAGFLWTFLDLLQSFANIHAENLKG